MTAYFLIIKTCNRRRTNMVNNTIKIKDDIYTLRYSIETLCTMTEQGYDPMDYL